MRAMIGPRPELDEELDELELLDEEELELLDELELELELEELELDELLELELLEELEDLPEELVELPEELDNGSPPQPVRPAANVVANRATGNKRVSGSCRNTTEAFMKSSWGYF